MPRATTLQRQVRRATSGVRDKALSGISETKRIIDERYRAWLSDRGYTDSTLGDVISAECAERTGEGRR